jgi:hypothetical protein
VVGELCGRPGIMADCGRFDPGIGLLFVNVDYHLKVHLFDYHIVFCNKVRKGRFSDVAFAHNHDTALGLDLVDLIITLLKLFVKVLELSQLFWRSWWNDSSFHQFTNCYKLI